MNVNGTLAKARITGKREWTLINNRDAYIFPCGCVQFPEHYDGKTVYMEYWIPCSNHLEG